LSLAVKRVRMIVSRVCSLAARWWCGWRHGRPASSEANPAGWRQACSSPAHTPGGSEKAVPSGTSRSNPAASPPVA
jgi:hypothetical protein